MILRIRFHTAAILLLGAAALAGPAAAQTDKPAGKVHSTTDMGQPAGPGGKVYSTDTVGRPADDGGKVYSTTALDPASAEVKKRFQLRFKDLEVGMVRRTPYGLFEVQVGMDLVYTDENVSWVMQGQLIDAMTRRDVTRESLESLGKVPFDQLPLDLAIKQVKGSGARKVAIFEDPNCGYCKQLRQTLQKVDDITIYTFLYPILAPDSAEKTRDVLCAKDPGAVWDDWMLRGRKPPSARCGAPLGELLALGRQLMVRGTPTLFFENGDRVSGAMPLDMLLAQLGER